MSPSDFKKGTPAWYEAAYKLMEFDHGFEKQIANAGHRVLDGMETYKKLEAATGVPAQMIGCLHNMEASCNFKAYLGNGERIIGTGRKSTIVPKGRGPFATFEEGALDALKHLSLVNIKNWSLGMELQWAERFNGTGYLRFHPEENSPYIWACTTINDGTGKYVRDGVYDPRAPTNGQVGVAAIYRWLELQGAIKIVYGS